MSPQIIGWPSNLPWRIRRLNSKAIKLYDKAEKLNQRLAFVTEPAERKRLAKAAKATLDQSEALGRQFESKAQAYHEKQRSQEKQIQRAQRRRARHEAKVEAVRRKRQAKHQKGKK